LEVGKKKGEIWYKLQDVGTPPGLIEEASEYLKEVDRLVAKYDVLTNKAEIDSQLDKAEEYTKKDKGASYWPKLKQRIEELLNKIKEAGTLPETPINKYIEELKKELEEIKEKPEIEYNKLKSIEHIQRKLDLIWEYKYEIENEVIETIRKEGDEGLKRAIDILKWRKENKTNWGKIKQNYNQGKVKINPPLYVIEDEVGVFTVDFGEEGLNKSYLARRGLTYDWEFTDVTPNKKTRVPVPPSRVKTNSLAKYFPDPGTWDIILTIRYKDETIDEPIEIRKENIRVRANEDIKWIKQISKVELGLFGAALLFAVLYGLQLDYVKKLDFGSPSDLVALFLWAVALDQGKNFIGWIKGIEAAQKQS